MSIVYDCNYGPDWTDLPQFASAAKATAAMNAVGGVQCIIGGQRCSFVEGTAFGLGADGLWVPRTYENVLVRRAYDASVQPSTGVNTPWTAVTAGGGIVSVSLGETLILTPAVATMAYLTTAPAMNPVKARLLYIQARVTHADPFDSNAMMIRLYDSAVAWSVFLAFFAKPGSIYYEALATPSGPYKVGIDTYIQMMMICDPNIPLTTIIDYETRKPLVRCAVADLAPTVSTALEIGDSSLVAGAGTMSIKGFPAIALMEMP